jgi:uncharacterized protein YvpB
MRRLALAGVVVMAAGCGSAGGHAAGVTAHHRPARRPPLRVRAGPISVELSPDQRAAVAAGGGSAAARVVARIAAQGRPHVALRLRFAASAPEMLARAARGTAAEVTVPARVVGVRLNLPRTRQGYRDDCEATALSIMLDGRVGQYRLQKLLPLARPLVPEETAHGLVWGDPERGFVGDVRGGGYGVYDLPLLALARRFDPGARNLTRHPLGALVAALRSGRPVVAWIQFGPSAPRTWTTPAGHTIHANFAEHAVTLTGWRPGWITYNNPWTGTRQTIPIGRFEALWRTLGDRAIEGSPVLGRAG